MSLRYNVSTLLAEPVGSTREYQLDAPAEEDAPRRSPIAGPARFLRTQHGVLVTAQLSGTEQERCSRCLREIDLPVSIELEEEFYATADVETGARLAQPEDLEAFQIDSQHNLDLEEAIRQYLAAAPSMQPLCKEDCRGLCPHCGQDLNQRACSCPPDQDGRWNALRQLVQKGE